MREDDHPIKSSRYTPEKLPGLLVQTDDQGSVVLGLLVLAAA